MTSRCLRIVSIPPPKKKIGERDFAGTIGPISIIFFTDDLTGYTFYVFFNSDVIPALIFRLFCIFNDPFCV